MYVFGKHDTTYPPGGGAVYYAMEAVVADAAGGVRGGHIDRCGSPASLGSAGADRGGPAVAKLRHHAQWRNAGNFFHIA
jgi:hypothetical protein